MQHTWSKCWRPHAAHMALIFFKAPVGNISPSLSMLVVLGAPIVRLRSREYNHTATACATCNYVLENTIAQAAVPLDGRVCTETQAERGCYWRPIGGFLSGPLEDRSPCAADVWGTSCWRPTHRSAARRTERRDVHAQRLRARADALLKRTDALRAPVASKEQADVWMALNASGDPTSR